MTNTIEHDKIAASEDFKSLERHEPEGRGPDFRPSRASIAMGLRLAVPLALVGVGVVWWLGGGGLALLAIALLSAVIAPPVALVWLRAGDHDRMIERASDTIESRRRSRLRGMLAGRSRRDPQRAEDVAAHQRQDDDGGPPEPS